jgi:hypothetical protein
MTATPDDLSPMERRLADVAAAAFEVMPPELIEECRLLVELDPTVRGIRCHHDGDDVVLTWVGRQIARVNREWVTTGELPEGN